ncbi:hypothetical protein [Occallatibacter savannae]|uniref:hypothetical protein n=1 Tax=Occallatibacter savannae TaxID=1002691 RepID=UPI0013A54217|nr:hypothetical protein [Occallatibacter savannae]
MHRLPCRLTSAALLSACLAAAQNKSAATDPLPSPESVMARVAANQDASEAERTRYVYVQHARMSSRKGKTILCEEITDYRFTPSTGDTHEQLLKVDGRMLKNNKYVTYDKLLLRDEENERPQRNSRSRRKKLRLQARTQILTTAKIRNPRTRKKRKKTKTRIRIQFSTPTATKPSTATSSRTSAGTSSTTNRRTASTPISSRSPQKTRPTTRFA